MIRLLFLLISLVLLTGENCFAETPYAELPGNKYVKIKLIADREGIQPADPDTNSAVRLGVLFEASPGWHIYWKNPGDAGLSTEVSWSHPQGWKADPLKWPAPEVFSEPGGIRTYGYAGIVLLTSKFFSPYVIPVDNSHADFQAKVSWLACKDVCVPGEGSVSIRLPFSVNNDLAPSEYFKLFEAVEKEQPLDWKALNVVINGQSFTAFKTLSSTNSLTLGEDSRGAIILEGFGKDFRPTAENIQFFPHAHSFIKVGSPLLHSGSNSAPVIDFPLVVLEPYTAGETLLEGILVLSKELSGTPQPSVLSWSLPLRISKKPPVKENPNYKTLLAAAPNSNALSYRAHEYKSAEDTTTLAPAGVFNFSAISFVLAILSAFIAGIILNFMPCVLPIVSIKVMGFIKQAEKSEGSQRISALMFTLGILASFLVLALAVIALRGLGQNIGWGFQFQHPGFVFSLFLVVFFLGLGFFDIYTFKLPFLSESNQFVSKLKHSPLSDFLEGVLTTALSTPCTAPLLGTALVFAFAAPPIFTIAVFLSIGAGLAAPFAYLSTHPKLLTHLPKPGAWMQRVKQLMGFSLLGTAVWLLYVLENLTKDSITAAISGALIIYFSFWLLAWVRDLKGGSSAAKIVIFILVLGGSASIILSINQNFAVDKQAKKVADKSTAIAWVAFSEERLAEAKRLKRPVFIDFTADWCVTCKFNEVFAIETAAVAAILAKQNALALKADWTTGDPAVTAALNRFGAKGVPLYVLIPPEGPAVVLPTIITKGMLTSAINRAFGLQRKT